MLSLQEEYEQMSDSKNVYTAEVIPPQKPQNVGQTSGMAIISMILGLSSFICTVFTGLIAIILGVLALSKISNSNGRVVGNGFAIAGIVTGAMGCLWTLVLIGMLIPAVQQVRTAARRTMTMNNTRQICLASLNYESANMRFPSNLSLNNPEAGENLSWRVHILPFLERQDLYDRFNLDEPWDSPTNIALIAEMPEVFQHIELELQPGYTVFQMPTSPANSETPAILVEGEKGVGFGSISDGSSNTILVMEVSESAAVPWTKPEDWQFDPDNPAHSLGDAFPGVFIAGLCDGSTHAIERDVAPEALKPLITRSAGDMVPPLSLY